MNLEVFDYLARAASDASSFANNNARIETINNGLETLVNDLSLETKQEAHRVLSNLHNENSAILSRYKS